MKKVIFCLILIFSIIGLSSCNKQPINTDSKKQIVVTLYPQYQMVKAILGSDKNLNAYYDVSLIVPYGCDIHNYDPSMSDLLLIKRAYAFIYTADEMETWVSLLKFSENTHVQLEKTLTFIAEEGVYNFLSEYRTRKKRWL